jgi:hypothetical protein
MPSRRAKGRESLSRNLEQKRRTNFAAVPPSLGTAALFMKHCPERRKKYWFGLKWGFKPHLFLITNAFFTLEDQKKVDVIRTCQYCEFKDVLILDRETVIELVARFPNAFSENLRSYLHIWMG